MLRKEALEEPDLIERFLREARSSARLKGEHICRVTDFGTTEGGLPFMVMEYLEGEDLGHTLAREGRLPWDRAQPILLQLLAALQAVHEQGGRAIVVTAKLGKHAVQHLAELGLRADEVIGELWSTAKGTALAEHGAEIYVGDHLGDITGARAADALAVGVATGPIAADDLAAAGADVVLPDLTQVPAWLDTYLLATVH
jgi:phosphoglycolate phosphatase